MAISAEEFSKLSSSEQQKAMNQLLKERTLQIARAELAPDNIDLPIPPSMEAAEKETSELLEKAKKGSTVYKLLKLQLKNFEQTRRFRKKNGETKGSGTKAKRKSQEASSLTL